MLAAPRSEPIAEPQELRLVDRREDGHHRRLDDLVLDGGDAERSQFAIGFRDIDPSRWQRPVRSPVNARMQISEVSVKVCCIVTPRHLIDADRRCLLQLEEGRPQSFDGDVVEERCELLLRVPEHGFTYAGLRL